jgi:integrase
MADCKSGLEDAAAGSVGDTFTLQAVQGNSSTTIARWVGNSSKVIEEKYLERLKLENLRPTDV